MIGSRDVTASGTGSVSHQSSIQAPTPEDFPLIGAQRGGPARTHTQVGEGSRDGRDGPTLSARHVVDFS